MKKHFSVVALLVLVFASSNAMAMIGFSVVGGAGVGLNSSSGTFGGGLITANIKSGIGYGGGVLFNLGLGVNSLEFGAIYMGTKTTATLNGVATDTTVNILSIPALVRFGGMWSLGVGGYYDLAMTSGNTSDYGVTAGPRLSLPGGLFFEARYKYGLKSTDIPFDIPTSVHTQVALLLAGFRFK